MTGRSTKTGIITIYKIYYKHYSIYWTNRNWYLLNNTLWSRGMYTLRPSCTHRLLLPLCLIKHHYKRLTVFCLLTSWIRYSLSYLMLKVIIFIVTTITIIIIQVPFINSYYSHWTEYTSSVRKHSQQQGSTSDQSSTHHRTCSTTYPNCT